MLGEYLHEIWSFKSCFIKNCSWFLWCEYNQKKFSEVGKVTRARKRLRWNQMQEAAGRKCKGSSFYSGSQHTRIRQTLQGDETRTEQKTQTQSKLASRWCEAEKHRRSWCVERNQSRSTRTQEETAKHRKHMKHESEPTRPWQKYQVHNINTKDDNVLWSQLVSKASAVAVLIKFGIKTCAHKLERS